MKNYVGISRDHSGSMRMIANAAARDYNDNISVIQSSALDNNIDTIVSVVKCGVGNRAENIFESVNSNVQVLQPITQYIADGGATPLFDSVVKLIDVMESVPDADDISVSFLVMVITDGGDNYSKITGKALGARIKKLQATDRWTFVFRVPRGESQSLINHGIPEGNVLEWDQTERGVQAASAATREAMQTFYADRASGKTSSKTFYSSLKDITKEEIAAALVDISSEVSIWPVGTKEAGNEIRDFVEKRLNNPMVKGTAFYQLNKTEKAVQDYKVIVVRDKTAGTVYSGDAARQMLGLPKVGDVRLKPGDHGDYIVYIQSTSTNRKVNEGTDVLYWPNAKLSN